MWLNPAVPLGFSTSQVPFLSVPQMSSAADTLTWAGKPAPVEPTTFAFKQAAEIFSPFDLVELERPAPGVANQAGDLVYVTYSKYNISAKENKHNVVIVPTTKDGVKPLEFALAPGNEVFWLDGATLAKTVEKDGKLELYALDLFYSTDAKSLSVGSSTFIGSIPSTTASNFEYLVKTGYLVFSAYVYEDGKLETVKEQDEAWDNRGNTALVYDSTFTRHWDTWVGPKRSTLFSVRLQRDPDHKWELSSEFVNILKGTGHSTPVEPFGGTDDFDIANGFVIYTAKDPVLPEALHTKQNVYIVDIEGRGKPKELTSGKQGATHSPVLNSQASKAAWLELDEDGHESDRHKIVIYDLVKDVRFTLTQSWDRSPDTIAFSQSSGFLYFTAGDHARVKTYVLPIPPTPSESTTHPKLSKKYTQPVALTHDRAATGLQPLLYGRALISKSSLVSPNEVFLVTGLEGIEEAISKADDDADLNLNTESLIKVERLLSVSEASLKGKKLSEGEEFWFKGGDGNKVQGWALKPAGWEQGKQKKYPAVLLIHGGPQGAWEDQWSTRWNPNAFASQGYFVIAINPTGSTTFGQAFTDAISGDWGGRVFVDLKEGWKHALDTYGEIDPERTVAAGASWGGYAINWIQGHPELGFNFKALVCHDGVFDAAFNGLSTDELFFFNHEWGGRPWDKKAKSFIEKFSPSLYFHKATTPQLIIHGSKDYRLEDAEGLAAFHALQQLNVPSRLVIFPDENHWVLKHGNSLKWHYEVFRWFDKWVGEKKATDE